MNPRPKYVCSTGLFHRLNNCKINSMNILGVQYDSKLSWSNQVSICIKKAKSMLHAIRLIKGYFIPKGLLSPITANFFSTLYYSSEIWLLPNLNPFSEKPTSSCFGYSPKTLHPILQLINVIYHLKWCFINIHFYCLQFFMELLTWFDQISSKSNWTPGTFIELIELILQLFKLRLIWLVV
jgi:hypothetical protein